MKLFVFVAVALFFQMSILAQSSYYHGLEVKYDECDPCHSSNVQYPENLKNLTFGTEESISYVASDFGPRYRSDENRYDWHGGIDFSPAGANGDKGFHLRAIVGGEIEKLHLGTGTKYIVIDGEVHDFGYLHIFGGGGVQQVGDCRVVTFSSDPDMLGILVPDDEGGYKLLTDCDDCEEDFFLIDDEKVYAKSTVEAGEVIAAMGDSGIPGGAHLHLNRYETLGVYSYFNDANTLDPLQYVEHFRPEYEISLHNNTSIVTNPENVPIGQSLRYPGDDASKLMLRAKMADENPGPANRYDHGTMNVASTELLLRKASETNFQTIRGGEFESKISLGAIDSETEDYPDYVGTTGIGNKGGWDKQGIFHFAYMEGTNPHGPPYNTEGGRPYDDYYFTDFITRIHRDDQLDDGILDSLFLSCAFPFIDIRLRFLLLRRRTDRRTAETRHDRRHRTDPFGR